MLYHPSSRLDAAENRFFLRQLEHIEQTLIEKSYPELKAMRLLPVRTGYAPGAVKHTYRESDSVGRAAIISDKSKKLPRVDVFGTETSQTVRPLGASFGYSIYEIKGAAMANVNLAMERASAAREIIMRGIENIAAIGNTETGLQGLVNHSSVSSTTAPNGAASSPLWSSKTALEKLADLNLAVQAVISQTNGIESPDTIILDDAHYTQIAQEPIGDNSDKTILQFFLQSSPYIRNVEPWHFCSTAGAGSTSRIMAYRRDPSKVELINPHGYEQLPPQPVGLEFEVACHMSTAGVVFYKPKSAYALDGV